VASEDRIWAITPMSMVDTAPFPAYPICVRDCSRGKLGASLSAGLAHLSVQKILCEDRHSQGGYRDNRLDASLSLSTHSAPSVRDNPQRIAVICNSPKRLVLGM
jgi:hypothetical protein